MIERYNRISLAIGLPGAVIQFVGLEMRTPIGSIIMAIGTILLMVGLAYYLKAKGHAPIFCILAFLSWFGIIILLFFPDRLKHQKENISDANTAASFSNLHTVGMTESG